MQHHHLVQGAPDWLAYRLNHDNASDAPVVMGVSPYKTRSQLLDELHTGITPEVSEFKQSLFASGHTFEALARPLAEDLIGEDLYPVTGSEDDGRMSASYDGLTMGEKLGFEHKRLNKELRAVLSVPGCTGRDLPMLYQVQMEQQCAVCPTIERILFMASMWERNHQVPEGHPGAYALVEELHCWYEPNLELRARIVAAWDQFHHDLNNYTPPKAAELVVKPTVVVLPAVNVEVAGSLVVRSNLEPFGLQLRAFIDAIPKAPKTDAEFGAAKNANKTLEKAEELLKQAKEMLLGKVGSLDEAVKIIDSLSALARQTRLDNEKVVEAQEKKIKADIVAENRDALAAHIKSLNDSLGVPYMPASAGVADFAAAIKGKRTLDSLKSAASDCLASAKAAASTIHARIKANLGVLAAQDEAHAHLFADAESLVLKERDDFDALVRVRVAEFKAAEEKRQAEEKERIEAAARKLVDEQQAVAQKAPAADPAPNAHALAPAPQLEVFTAAPAANEPPAGTVPTLRIGVIAERLGWSMTEAQLRSLSIEPAVRERGAPLYHEHQFPAICEAIAKRALLIRQDYLQPRAA